MNAKPAPAFSLRPAFHSDELLIEFGGDTHSPGYPDIQAVLAQHLQAQPRHDLTEISFDSCAYVWEYANGSYLIDKDNWAIFILASQNNAQIMADLERALLASGLFTQQTVDFNDYR